MKWGLKTFKKVTIRSYTNYEMGLKNIKKGINTVCPDRSKMQQVGEVSPKQQQRNNKITYAP